MMRVLVRATYNVRTIIKSVPTWFGKLALMYQEEEANLANGIVTKDDNSVLNDESEEEKEAGNDNTNEEPYDDSGTETEEEEEF